MFVVIYFKRETFNVHFYVFLGNCQERALTAKRTRYGSAIYSYSTKQIIGVAFWNLTCRRRNTMPVIKLQCLNFNSYSYQFQQKKLPQLFFSDIWGFLTKLFRRVSAYGDIYARMDRLRVEIHLSQSSHLICCCCCLLGPNFPFPLIYFVS